MINRDAVPALSTDLFRLTNEDPPALVAEASSLPRDIYGQIFTDACDQGFILVSSRTGAGQPFAVSKDVRRDGDLLYTELVPVDERGPVADPMCIVRIFND